MPRPPNIWWHSSRKIWCVNINGKQVRLSRHKAEAKQKFHELMAAKGQEKPIQHQELLLAEIPDRFIDWCLKHREKRTAEGYQVHWQRFLEWLPGAATMEAKELKPYHVIEYIDAHDWGDSYKRQAAGAVQRAFKWAVAVGLLDSHPCCSIPKPKGGRRETPMSAAEYQAIVANSRPDFRDVVTFAWETGARPHEVRTMRPEYVQEDRVVYPVQKSKGKRRSRVIYLNDVAAEIVHRRCETANEWVFVNARGVQWSVTNINCRLGRLKTKVGRKVALVDARHGFTERMLDKGIGHLTVAALLGHTSGQMVANVYSHRNQADEHLKAAVGK